MSNSILEIVNMVTERSRGQKACNIINLRLYISICDISTPIHRSIHIPISKCTFTNLQECDAIQCDMREWMPHSEANEVASFL